MSRAASWLERNPDERTVRWGWTIWLAWGVVAGALLVIDVKAGTGALSFVLVAPFWAMWLLWPVYRAAHRWWRWHAEASWTQWNGVYYEFDGRQIRVLTQGDSIWIVADDVFDVLGLQGRQCNTARVRQIAGRDGLVHLAGSRRLVFSEVGIRAWLDRRTDAAAAKFTYWLDKQVIAPFRRRRDLAGDVEGEEAAG